MKFSGPDGGPALPEITKDIEKRADALPEDETPFHDIEDNFDHIDPRAPYFAQLEKMIRFDVLAKMKGTLAYDAVHGCGGGWLDRVLKDHGIAVSSIRENRNVLFDGTGPDPSEENLAPLKKLVLESKAVVGLATDGDADRFGILDSDGSFVFSVWYSITCSKRAAGGWAHRAASRPRI